MRVDIRVPPIGKHGQGFLGYWVKAVFIGRISEDAATNALVDTYIRLVEAAILAYQLGEKALREFWNNHGGLSLSALNRSVSHFEACTTDMHRAIRCLKRLRGSAAIPQPVKALAFQGRPKFLSDAVAGRIMGIRDTLYHFEEKVFNGDLPQGSKTVLSADGPEIPDDNDPSQTIKVIDRITIGSLAVQFSELAVWLEEMGDYAQQITDSMPSKRIPNPP